MKPLSFEEILASTKQLSHIENAGDDCVDLQSLIDFAYGDLDADAERSVSRHLDQCDICSVTELKISADRHQWELEMAISPDTAIARTLGTDGQKAVRRLINGPNNSAFSSTVMGAVSLWVSDIWTPQWTGQAITAVDVPEQQHYFDMGDGEYVDLRCSWEGVQTRQKPKIRFSWSANIFTLSNIWIHFIDPDTEETIDKICLGTDLEGTVTIAEPELKFDPSYRSWGLLVSVESE